MFTPSPRNKQSRLGPVFRTPMTFSPRLEGNKPVPSPSRDELWRKQLGFDDVNDTGTSSGSDDDDMQTKDDKENFSMVEFHSLQRQLEERNKQRDELLFKVKTLTEKTKQYKQKLEKEETTKRQQMKILCKTQEIKLLEKDSLIDNLQSMVEEQEYKILMQEQTLHGENNGKKGSTENYNSPATLQMIEDVKRLQIEKADLCQKLDTVQSELESFKCTEGQTDESLKEIIAKLEKENQQLKEDLSKYNNIQLLDTGPCHTDTEKQVEKLQQENEKLYKDIEDLQQSQTRMRSVYEQSTQQHQTLEDEIKRLKEKCDKLQNELSQRKNMLEVFEIKKKEEITKLEEENRKTSRRMRDLMVEVTHLQSKEPEIVTKIKVVEVQVDSSEIKEELKACQDVKESLQTRNDELKEELKACQDAKKSLQTRNDELKEELKACKDVKESLQTRFNELQDRHEVTTVKLEQEQICNVDLSNEVTNLSRKLTEMAQVTADKLQQAEEEKDEAIKQLEIKAVENMNSLQTKYDSLCQSVAIMNPKYAQLIQAYILLEKQVKEFPRKLKEIVSGVKKETNRAIQEVSDYNKDLVRRYHREMYLRKKYHNELVELKGNIRVFCRVRPKIKEDGGGMMSQLVIDYDKDDDGLIYVNNKGRTQTFDADRVFTPSNTQEEVFDEVQSLVTSCIDGYNVCIFAYGQTGSGKTFTMEGETDNPGINQRALIELFKTTKDKGRDWSFTITMSVMEIYNEVIRDLLSDEPASKMEVKMNPEGGLHVPGLSTVEVQSVKDVNQVFTMGQRNRATASTNMNEHSSRSHALLCITVTGVCKTTNTRTIGKLNLVDLAGSERVSKSGADGARLKEAQNINKSLSCLGDVIHALRCKQSHVPYRNSKLTYLLQDSLGGDSKTLMIVQISPVEKNLAESVCSLNFAQRVRSVELGQASKRVETGEESDGPGTPTKTLTPMKAGGTPGRSATPGRTQSMVVTTPRAQMAPGTPLSKCPTPGSGVKLTPLSKYQQRK